MIHLPICPVCDEPVVDRPAQNWASAYRSGGGAPWWHLADNRPICPAEDASHSQPVFVEDGLPADSETSTWINAMTDLFPIDGPCDPARLGSAITAAEHLTRWLHTATGPVSALMALRTPSDVAFLIGHLHRTTRLLARVHVQTGLYFLDQARQPRFTGLDDSEVRGEVIDAADDVHAWLQDAADCSAQSARATGVAWSHTRKVTALMTATGRADEHESTGVASNTRSESTGPDVPQEPSDTFEPFPAHVAELIGSAFGDEAGFSPELTRTATRSLGTLTSYLSNCLGLARPIAIPPQDLAGLTTSLTYLTDTLHNSLRQVVEHSADSDPTGLDEAHTAALRASLARASEALRRAAQNLADAAYHAASLDPSPDQS